MCWSWEKWLIESASLGRVGHYLHCRMKTRITGHMLIAGVLGWWSCRTFDEDMSDRDDIVSD
jgi:hypothetical protein